ncbi:MAG: carbonic anhydrase, partial [Steroidobacteraceae bacterium]
EEARLMRLCELNVLAQAINVAETTLLQDAWNRGQPVSIHSLIYGLDNGILRQLGPSLARAEAVEVRKRELGW